MAIAAVSPSITQDNLVDQVLPHLDTIFAESKSFQRISNIVATYLDESPFLHWTQRPKEVNDAISKTFAALQTKGEWGVCNGIKPKYGICSIDEHALVAQIIRNAPLTQKTFYILDIGAGEFGWGRALVQFINTDQAIASDITVQVISVRGEPHADQSNVAIGKCRVHELGQFKVEELHNEFKKRGLNLEGNVDLIASHWCFRHLVDPVGTFAQAYDLLRPKAFFLGDGFFFLSEREQIRDYYEDETHSPVPRFNQVFLALLQEIAAPFLMYQQSTDVAQFILQRPDATACQLSMSYHSLEHGLIGSAFHSLTAARCAALFNKQFQDRLKSISPYIAPSEGMFLVRGYTLFSWLKRSAVFKPATVIPLL
jgi:SAM-dependent methyltransferase